MQIMEIVDLSPNGEPNTEAWFDVATVTVPARTKRKSVITAGLKQAGLEIGPDSLKVRALNAESAHVLTVGLEPQEPQLRIA